MLILCFECVVVVFWVLCEIGEIYGSCC